MERPGNPAIVDGIPGHISEGFEGIVYYKIIENSGSLLKLAHEIRKALEK